MFKLSFDLRTTDIQAYSRYLMFASPYCRQCALQHLGLAMALFGLFVLSLYRVVDVVWLHPSPMGLLESYSLVVALLLFPGFVLFHFLQRAFLDYLAIQAIKHQGVDDRLHYNMDFNQEGIKLAVGANPTLSHPWTDVQALERSQDYVFLFMAPMVAYVIPSSAFDDETHILNFLHTVQTYLQQAHTSATATP